MINGALVSGAMILKVVRVLKNCAMDSESDDLAMSS